MTKLEVKGSADDILRLAYGGKTPMQDGGKAEGPSHEDGGIPVVQEGSDEPAAEIEGGERVFSVEDTQALEEASMHIIDLQQKGDEESANDMAMRLGYAVVNMIAEQERNQAEQEAGAPAKAKAEAASEAEAMNSFGEQ